VAWPRFAGSAPMSEPRGVEALEQRLQLTGGFTPADRDRILRVLGPLAKHLAKWKPEQIGLQASVKHRDGKEQKVTLEVVLPGMPPLVASSVDREIDRALVEVRKDLIRQIEDAKDRREPHKGKRAH
jgi:ribosome-associated translation inhibitor RaiA